MAGRRRQGLADWDISRDAPYFGIPIPDAPGKYFYVWLDAPVGYLASLKEYVESGKARAVGETRSFEQILADPDTRQIHFIGKDIIYFHTLFWPAMLKFAGAPYKVPDNVYVHGFITALGEKMSKSRGTGISPDLYLDLGLDPEWLRYYIAAKLNDRVEDIDFNPDDFIARVNSDLIGKYVNIASRAARFITEHFDGELAMSPDDAALLKQTLDAAQESAAARYDARQYSQGDTRRDGHRRPHQRGLRPGQAVGDREGRGATRRAAGDLLARACAASSPERGAGAGTAGARVARRTRALRARPRLRLVRRDRPARSHPPFHAPDDAHRSETGRRPDRRPRRRLAGGGSGRGFASTPAPSSGPPARQATAHRPPTQRSRSTTSRRSSCASRGSSMPSTSTAPTSC